MALLFSARELRNILRVGLPIFVAQLSQIGMNFVDTVMAGRYSATDLAGVAVAGSIWAPSTLFAVGCLLALPGMSAQLVGAKKPERSGHLLRQGMALSLALCLVVGTFLYLVSRNLHLLDIDPEIVPVTAGYLRAMLPGLPGFLLFINVRSFLEGFGRTRPAMIIGLVCLLVNIPCNYVFIYGHLGMPSLGGVGCGVATSICYWVMFLSILFFLSRDATLRRYALSRVSQRGDSRAQDTQPRESQPCGNRSDASSSSELSTPDGGKQNPSSPVIDLPLILHVLRVGFPNAVALCVEVSLFALTALLLAPLGTTVVAGHQITINYSSIVFSVPLSIGMTATILVGQRLGAGKQMHARAAAQTALLVGVCMSLVSMTATIVFRERIAALYNNDPQVLALAASLMLLCGAYQVVDTLQNIACGVLRGYNDTRIISYVCLCSYGGVGLCGGYVLGRTDLIVPAMGAAGFWIGYIAALSVCAVCYLTRLHMLHHMDMETIRRKLAR